MTDLNKIITDPFQYNETDIQGVIDNYDQIKPEDFKAIFFRIFNLNEFTFLGEAKEGHLGRFNRKSNEKRRKRNREKLRQGKPLKRIYAEGDSWFQHPTLKDIIDHLNKAIKKEPKIIFNSAMGGDWLLNYLQDNVYIEEISKYNPDIVLLSGGGNDIVGKSKIAHLVDTPGYFQTKLNDGESTLNSEKEALLSIPVIKLFLNEGVNIAENSETVGRLFNGFKLMSKEFFSIIWFLDACYSYLITNVTQKHENIKFVLHGYDYVVPSNKKQSWFGFKPKRALIHRFMDNGHWLYDALAMRNIYGQDQKDVLFVFIYCFNEMIIRLKDRMRDTADIQHVDLRGVTKSDEWFDEMHPTSKAFKKMADRFLEHL